MILINPSNKTILEELKSQDTLIECPCRGLGTCGKCKVKILSGKVTPTTSDEINLLSAEEISNNIRLACQTKAISDIQINLLFKNTTSSKILTDGYMPKFNINPTLRKVKVSLNKSDLSNFKNVSEYFSKSMNIKSPLSINLLKKLPMLLDAEYGDIIMYNDEILDIGDSIDKFYGIAIDIGTTTVACSLIDMTTFKEVDSSSFINPQKEFGLDVLSRIHYANETPDGIDNLQHSIVKEINSNIEILCVKNNLTKTSIYEVVIGANSTMLHCLLGIPINTLGKSPYASVFTDSICTNAIDIGININSRGKIYCIPSVSTYIGGDIVSGILASKLYEKKENTLFIDIGTNGEIVLCKDGNLISCSCAAGPALEGMNISCGMRAANGAIEGVKIVNNHISLKIIEDNIPTGICGSGILEVVSELLSNEIIGTNGRLKSDSPLVYETDGKLSMTLYEGKNKIYITQKDIRQVQLSKGAILSGFLALLKYKNITMDDLDTVMIAGQFGKHLSPESLTGVGIIPKDLINKIEYIGNSSRVGALMCLLSKDEKTRAELIAQDVDYIELSNIEDYEKIFTKALMFN
ncbi:ASKHA domain-containing protein [Clostridium sp.]|uniref:ASKHA domain-containing protein n=1 Tax=Clostridium sp. TaxID=1506 RepID=UPI003216D264